MLEIDGSKYSGSGTIVRQSVAFAALTRKAVRIVNVRLRRPKPGLRRQHVQVVEAIRQLVGGSSEGVAPGSKEFVFRPGNVDAHQGHYLWDIGSAGSTTALAIAVLPVLAFTRSTVSVELRGGVFQDFAPSFYHLQHVLMPLLRRMGVVATVRMDRPGYVPSGGGIVHLQVTPSGKAFQPLILNEPGHVEKLWGVALSSRLRSQSVSDRMASALRTGLAAGHDVEIQVLYDDTALQAGACLAAFADLSGGSRLGSDRAGAPGRRSETIGKYVARQLLDDLKTRATLDRHASDQIIPFAALASGESRFRIPELSQHVQSNAWLAKEFLGAEIDFDRNEILVRGIGFQA